MLSRLCILLILFPVALLLRAQEQSIELDPVTVTATITPLQASKTGRNIIHVKGELLRQLPVQSVDELLRYLPGLEVQSRGPMGTQSNITIRGGTFQQVLILLDGIRLNDPLTGHFNSYIPISPGEIERIEILKGASSAVYGTEAVGGVVHIITRSFAAQKDKQAQQLQAQLTSGQYGLRNAQAGFFYQKNKTVLGGGLQQNVADGQPLRGTNGFFNLNTVSLSVKQFVGNRSSIAYRGGYDDRNFNAQNFYTQLLSDSATERVISRWHHLNYSLQQGRGKLTIDAGYKDASDRFQLRKNLPPNTNRSTVAQALALHSYQFSNTTTLTSGLQWINRGVRSNNRGNHNIQTAGAFVVLHQQLGEGFQFNPALRADWNERAGWELIPQVNLSYRTGRLQLRGSAGRSTRDADFTERFNNYQPPVVASGNRIGNPGLTAESSFSYEAGTDIFPLEGVKLSVGWFQRFHRDLIDYVTTPYASMPRPVNLVPGGTYSLAKNLDRVNTRGLETDLQLSRSFGNRHSLLLTLGGIWMKSTSSDTVPSLYVSNHARFLFNFSSAWRYRSLALSLNGLYKERRPQQGNAAFVPLSRDYFLLNLRVEGYLMNDQLCLFAQADNALNRRYADILGTVMPGSWLMGGIKLNLK
ncbi:MAG TPA: TonB-dependent receptor plug domain-containing protein [Lacibacter sp.]|nr:TonB-dependent receptor plug domain-containing protein [Lacibacter sp.]HMO89808.1 TonB-dependent receptor plug domain-containing protein [Lacibacter sp.]